MGLVWTNIYIFIFLIKYGLEFMGPGVAGCGQGQAFGSGHIARVKACRVARSVVMLQSANVVGETWGARIAIPRHCSGF